MERIADVVARLTPAEREQFSDLIKECTEREHAITVGTARARDALARLERHEQEFRQGMAKLERAAQELMERTWDVYLRMANARGVH